MTPKTCARDGCENPVTPGADNKPRKYCGYSCANQAKADAEKVRRANGEQTRHRAPKVVMLEGNPQRPVSARYAAFLARMLDPERTEYK